MDFKVILLKQVPVLYKTLLKSRRVASCALLMIWLCIFNAHSQSYSCMRCGGDGLIEKRCVDCEPYRTPKQCYNCQGKGKVSEEGERYFQSSSVEDLVPQFAAMFIENLKKNPVASWKKQRQDYRNSSNKHSFSRTAAGLKKKIYATTLEDYFMEVDSTALFAGNFWSIIHNNQTLNSEGSMYKIYDYRKGWPTTEIFTHDKILPKKPVILNIQFRPNKKLVLEPEFYLTDEAKKGSYTLAYGRHLDIACNVEIYNSDRQKIKSIKDTLSLRQWPSHLIKSHKIDGVIEDFILTHELDSWATNKNVDEEYYIKVKFLDFELETKVVVGKKNKIVKAIRDEFYRGYKFELYIIDNYNYGWRNYYINRDESYEMRKLFDLKK